MVEISNRQFEISDIIISICYYLFLYGKLIVELWKFGN